jgi:hypothetical protein
MMEQLSNGTKYWKRDVLISGPGEKFEYFDAPPGYIDSDGNTGPEEEPQFDIPGYPTAIFGLISLAAIAFIIKKRRY